MKIRGLVIAVAIAGALAPSPASAAQASCGGLSPLETSCSTSYRTSTGRPFLDMVLPEHFLGSYRLAASSSTGSVTQDCDIELQVSSCSLSFIGSFGRNQIVFLTAEIRSIRSPLPAWPGEWRARIHD